MLSIGGKSIFRRLASKVQSSRLNQVDQTKGY